MEVETGFGGRIASPGQPSHVLLGALAGPVVPRVGRSDRFGGLADGQPGVEGG